MKMHTHFAFCSLRIPHIKRYPSIDREAPLIDARAPPTHGWARTTNTQRRAEGLQEMWRHLSAMWRFKLVEDFFFGQDFTVHAFLNVKPETYVIYVSG